MRGLSHWQTVFSETTLVFHSPSEDERRLVTQFKSRVGFGIIIVAGLQLTFGLSSQPRYYQRHCDQYTTDTKGETGLKSTQQADRSALVVGAKREHLWPFQPGKAGSAAFERAACFS